MFVNDIKKVTKENTNFRKVICTGKHTQIVVMSIPVNGDIGDEVHSDTDQTLVFVEGEGTAILNGEVSKVQESDIVFVPAGTRHNFKNVGKEALKLFTVYAPPEHPAGTIHKTKEEAEKSEE